MMKNKSTVAKLDLRTFILHQLSVVNKILKDETKVIDEETVIYCDGFSKAIFLLAWQYDLIKDETIKQMKEIIECQIQVYACAFAEAENG